MRIALAALVLAGCMQQDTQPYPPDPGPGPGPGGTPYYCQTDADCGGGSSICARDGSCVAASDVYTVHIAWTVQGATADATSCASSPDLELDFDVQGLGGVGFGFAPVPCMEGKFTIDKLPTMYTHVQLLRAGDGGGGASAAINPSSDTVTLDLPY